MKKLVRKYAGGNSLSGGGTTQSGVQKFMNSKSGAIYSGVVSGIGNAASMIGQATQLDKTYNANDALSEGLRNSASDALLSSGNPYAMAAGAAIKVVGATGGFTDGTKGLGTGNDIANTIASMAIPGAGWFVKKLPDYHESQELKETSSYGQTQAQAEKVGGFAGSKALFGRNKAKRLISEQKIADAKVSDVINTGKEDFSMAAAMSDYNTNQYNMDINGGWNRKVSVGKKGLKFEYPDDGDTNDYTEEINLIIQKFKTGNKILKHSIGELTESDEPIVNPELSEISTDPELSETDIEPSPNVPWNSTKTHVIEGDTVYTKKQYQTAKNIWNYCRNVLKWTPEQTAAIMGSMMQESSLNIDAIQNGGDFAKGWFQMHSDELNNYKAFKKRQKKITPYTQLDYIHYRLPQLRNAKVYWNSKNFKNIAKWFVEEFEKSGKPEYENRYKYSQHFLKWFNTPTKKENGGVIEFKDGGQMNVIPEGALHARKHHMENDENITKKGIPVIDNDGEQQAEIELNEIIFTKEVTQKLEEYWKDGSDEAAIKAGKLIAKEIMENTDDRTGLIETID